ncbi:ABC transporter ATP-binding protein, partial [Enterococcus faecium]
EPSSGLDPAGIAWLRSLVRERAARRRTVLLSSHVLAEVQQSVDDVVLLDAGRTAWSGTLEDLVATAGSLERAVLAATGAGAAS